ncbi:SulP family inorganic anion transporter [Bythopirellula polymerisocia]|nr:SulP family inorganic anion transporter [Bythopirellula polymerisocia]
MSIFKSDLLASIVVFLVALPLCMGIAIASGAPVAAGLITGIIGGIIVGSLAGCPLQVSGPAAGLTVIVYEIIQTMGLEMLGLAVLLAGVIQIVAGLLRWGQWFRAVSPAVIQGMLAGIGFLIVASQFHVMIDDKPKGSGAQNLATIPQAIAKSFALPEFAPTEVRRIRSKLLHEVGELHRQQVNIHERLAEHVPHLPGAIAPTDIELEPPAVTMPQLVEQQQGLVEQMTGLMDEVDQLQKLTEGSKRSQRIVAASTAALSHSEAALEGLEKDNLGKALQLQTENIMVLEDLLASLKNHHLAAGLGMVTILAILLWQGFAPKKLQVIPAPLVAIVLATILATVFVVPVLYVEIPNNLWEEVRVPNTDILRYAPWADLAKAAVLLAVVASAETLLCATAVDQMQQGPRTAYDRELFAQGIGNVLCGLVGALPMTGVIVRSSANIQAGGKTRLSAIFHGVWLLLFVSVLAFLLRLIPTSSLAAMLVYTGYKLINVKSMVKLRQYGWGEVAIYAATVGTIIFTDLLSGVLVGIALSAGKLLYTFSHLEAKLSLSENGEKDAVLKLKGSATFIRLPKLAAVLERVPEDADLHVDFSHLDYIDHACLELLMNWAKQHESGKGNLVMDWGSLHSRVDRMARLNQDEAEQLESVV